jgi:tRNA (cytidine/uridine-2'-O-)-methyltransferase
MIHVVLFEPEIPQNTGNILRSCVAFGATLHVIHPLGFLLSQQAFKRAKMDYGDLHSIIQHDDWEDFNQHTQGKKIFVTRYGKQAPDEIDYRAYNEDIYIIFGKESTGLPLNLLARHLDDCIRIPMSEHARSLNLANSAAIVLYEVSKQLGYPSLSKVEVQKGADWLDQHK